MTNCFLGRCKKISAIALVLLLLFSSVSISAYAVTPSNSVDIGIDCLLSTFDLTKSQELIRTNTRSIIDKDKIENSDLVYGMLSGAKSYAENFSGSNAVSYAQDAGVNISAAMTEKINFTTLFKLSLSSKIDASVKSAYRTSTESFFSTFKVIREVGVNKIYLVSESDYEILRSILNESFKNALYSADTKEEVEALYNLYGTHMITSYALGGFAEATTSTVNISDERKNELSAAYSYGAEEKAKLGQYGAGLKIAFSAQGSISTEYNSSEYKTAVYNKVCGGVGGLNFGDASDANEVYNSWIATIDPYDSTTTEIISDRNAEFVPLWDILPKEYAVQKSVMKQVYLERLGVFNNEFNRTFIYSTGETVDIESFATRLKADNEIINTSAVPEGYIPIYTPAQFTAIGKGEYPLNGNYILMNDIDFTDASFEMIGGCGEESFSGLFEGNGYTVRNITYSKKDINSVEYCGGLFAENKGVIKNLTLENIKFDLTTKENAGIKNGTHAVGVLCGKNSGTIQKCKIIGSDISYMTNIKKGVDNTITSCMGAVAGINAGTIRFAGVEETKCYLNNYLQEATNSSKNNLILGGIAGKSVNGSISDCYVVNSEGLQVKGTSFHDTLYTIFAYHTPIMNAFVGGILGDSEGDNNLIERCFVKSVYGDDIIKNDLSITQKGNCESSDKTTKCIGSIIGYNRKDNNTIRACYYMDGPEYGKTGWLFDIVYGEIAAPEGCAYLNSLQGVKNTFVSNGWKMANNESYPAFAAEDRNFSIVIDSPQIKNGLYADDILDMDNVRIYLRKQYDGAGVYEDITKGTWILYDFSSDSATKIQFVYFSDDFVCCGELPISLKENKIESLEIDNMPDKTEFAGGTQFSSNGLVLKLNYSNGTYEYVTDGYSTDYDDVLFTQLGEHTVTVSCKNHTVQYDIVCGECETHSFTEVVDDKYEFSDATCDHGKIYYKSCSVCKVKGDETFEHGVSLGHLEIPHIAKTPSCTGIGWDAYVTCGRADCEYTTYNELPKLEHLEIPHIAKTPSCTEIGWDAYVTCDRADCEYTTYEEKPSKGHNWGAWKVKEAATTEKEGTEIRECNTCKCPDERKIEIIKPEKLIVFDTAKNTKLSSNGFVVVNAETFVKDILKDTNGTEVQDKNGSLDSISKLSTGMKLVLKNGDKVIDSKIIVVLGDIDGDGVISAADARLALRCSVELESLTNEKLAAAMVNGAKNVTAAEARLILRASVDLENNTAWLEKIS